VKREEAEVPLQLRPSVSKRVSFDLPFPAIFSTWFHFSNRSSRRRPWFARIFGRRLVRRNLCSSGTTPLAFVFTNLWPWPSSSFL
jgi:hypothetical protein